MSGRHCLVPALVLCLSCLLFPAALGSTYPVSSPPLGRRFDGIGGLSGGGATSRFLVDYPEPQRSEILDYLFLPGFAASLQILKVEIGGDAQSTEGTEASHMHVKDEENYERGYEWWLMQEAKRRNPHIKLYGLAWGWPRWVGEGTDNPLTESAAQYVTKFATGLRDVYGLDLDYVGIWNEAAYDKAYITALHRQLRAANLSTVIVASDDCCDATWSICDALRDDDEFRALVGVVGGHYPNSETPDSCQHLEKPIWASEDFSSYFQAGGCWSRLLNRNYALSNMTATIAWNLIAAYYDELPWGGCGLMHAPAPWSGYYEVGQAIWASAHTTQFVDVGWRYLAHGSGVGMLDGGGSFVSLTDGKQLSIVVESIAHDLAVCAHEDAPTSPVSKQSVTFALQGDFASVSSLQSFVSSYDPQSPVVNFQYAGSVDVSGGQFSFTLLPNQLWTFSTRNGSKGGHPQPPPRAAFPIPYSDSFDSARLHSQARYLTDQSGSFEVVEARNASRGRVLRQMMPAYPIPWCGDAPFPYSVIGDHSWGAVNASVDVLLEQAGTALLAVGVDSGGCVGGGGSRAIVLSVNSSGVWTVSNSTALLHSFGSGRAQMQSGQWTSLAVRSHAAGSDFLIDGQLVLSVAELSSDRFRGWVAIGSSYDYVQFDNLVIEQGAAAVKNVQSRTE